MMSLRILCAAAVLLFGATTIALAVEPGASIPPASLAAMGFENVQPMTDGDGLAVRGKGSRVTVWGTGYGPIIRRHFAYGSSRMVSGSYVSGGRSWGFSR